MEKKGEFGFVWIFAIVVGGLILFLAVYGALKFGGTEEHKTNTEIARQLEILTDPLQAGFAEGSYGKIEFNEETRIKNYCLEGGFGKNEISVSIRSNAKNKEWTDSGDSVAIYSKYIFSEETNQGEDFYVFSKPFEFPYKVSDLIFFSAGKYCFISAPDEVSSEISALKMPNIVLENCSTEDVRVCFDRGSDCDIRVYGACTSRCDSQFDYGTVEKDGQDLKYVGSLMYGAIFASKEIYECNVNRLLDRDEKIASVLAEKAEIMNSRDCSVNLQNDIIMWKGMLANTTVQGIISLESASDELNQKNDEKQCNLW